MAGGSRTISTQAELEEENPSLMALQRIPGRGPYVPGWFPAMVAPAFSTTPLIDATGEMTAFCGRVVWFDRARTGTRNISRAGFRFGAVTKAGGSALTVSLQDVDLTTGPVMVPDGTQDQTVAVANADAAFASNTWYRTGTFSATRPVAYGALLAVVIEYDGSGRVGADSVIINGMLVSSNLQNLETVNPLKTSGSWANLATSIPNLMLEFDDGGFGILEFSTCVKTINTHTYNSGSAADEFAMAFQVPYPCVVDGLWAMLSVVSATANVDIVLYDGTSSMASTSVDGNAVMVNNTGRPIFVPIAEQTLAANHTYYVSVKPTTANNVTAYSFDVDDANHWTIHDGGTNFNYSTRVDAGSWAAVTTTRRLLAGVRLSQLDGGGGMIQSRVFTGA